MRRLAEHFVEADLPDVLDLPTGSAKTAIVIIWAWARQQNEALPRRLWMVSDRRVIVDQTLEVARVLAKEGVLVSRLRGGIVPEDAPVLDPVSPQVISATVDQLGSRLLFRAYGPSPRSWPIWAGLAGNDSLIVLDEAHLSPAAEDTFRACVRMGGQQIRAARELLGWTPYRLAPRAKNWDFQPIVQLGCSNETVHVTETERLLGVECACLGSSQSLHTQPSPSDFVRLPPRKQL